MTGKKKSDDQEKDLEKALDRPEPDDVGQIDENRNLTGSTTYETLGEEMNDENQQHGRRTQAGSPREQTPNPPRTTTGPITAPKFGSAGSGGLELEPGPERD